MCSKLISLSFCFASSGLLPHLSHLSLKQSCSLLLNQMFETTPPKKKEVTCLHVQSFNFRFKQIEGQANKYAQNRTVDEVIKSLKNRVIKQAATTKDSFLFLSTRSNHKGKINKSGLQKVGKMFAVFLTFVPFPGRYCLSSLPFHTARVKSSRTTSVTDDLNRSHAGYCMSKNLSLVLWT